MHYLIYTLVDWGIIYFFVGSRFLRLWQTALIGLGITIVADYFGMKYNLYYYTKGIIHIGNQPVFALVNAFANCIIYLNWLPQAWGKRILYTVCASTLFLAVEAAMFSVGAIQYPNWELWYSYFLLNSGLLLMVYLADLLKVLPKNRL
ncbi:hypothetical protein [Desulfotomaculum sp. 1211_IL3151]|uniref:hypothetical protein n=1 Tax=Desulfotomaculum sp. 1211_IL3151 TaxID=3084055 RepID=UPI002FD9C183